MTALRVAHFVTRINRVVALAAGGMLLLCVALILAEIVLRRFGAGFGGTDELSGYVMAIATAWGLSWALVERAHVRIDLLRARLGQRGRGVFDILALWSMAAVVITVAWKSWSVLEKTLSTGATANTALGTPLWIPQTLWWAGWVWFAICCAIFSVIALALMLSGRADEQEELIGMGEGE